MIQSVLHGCKNKDIHQLPSKTAQLISGFVFATHMQIVESLCVFLNPKFQASSHLLWLCKPLAIFCVCTARFVSDLMGTHEDNEYTASLDIFIL